jgi:hypothetical protein
MAGLGRVFPGTGSTPLCGIIGVASGRWHDWHFYDTIPPNAVDASTSNPLMLQDANVLIVP